MVIISRLRKKGTPIIRPRMPRPGPRPYECVRRAWHSERHHPIRGSLIQDIFRIVNEAHCSATRKNREWQEKLPIVVLKAEEIMYSKANSEAEYSDLKTLWDRVSDAINTIIRRDESTETGELLQPCIEAALHLGCTPRRSSRSQRNDSPRSYLRPDIPGDTSVPPSNSDVKFYGNHTTNSPLMLHYSQYGMPNATNTLPSCLKFDSHIMQDRNCNHEKSPELPKKYASNGNQYASVQTLASSNGWSVFPLYNYDQVQPNDLKFHSKKPTNSYPRLVDIDKLGVPRNLSPDKLDGSSFSLPPNHKNTCDKGYGVKCDLTLRLGSLVVPCTRIERNWSQEEENVHSNTSSGGSKFKSCLK